ncbi:MAG: GLPGLI family protein [Bacteroidota bacterium]
MKKIICLLIAIGIGTYALSYVKSTPKKGRVTYIYTTTFKGIPMPREAVLTFDQDESLFVHSQGKAPKIFDRSGNEVSYETMTTTNVANKGVMFGLYFQDPIGNVYYKNSETQEMIFREIVINKPFLVKEPKWIEFDWKLGTERKQIGNFSCLSATTYFRGRTYKAWYTPEIPLSLGPWKFHGLPGLILEVEDDKQEVSFKAQTVEIPTEQIDAIAPPEKGEKVSLESFMEADYRILSEMQKAEQAMREGKGGNFTYSKDEIVKVEMKLD